MIDIKILRNNPEIIKKTLHDKVTKGVDLDRVIQLDVARIALRQELDALRMRRNDISSQMKQTPRPSGTPLERNPQKPEPHILAEAKEIKEKIQTLEPEFDKLESEFYELYKKIPNIPTSDTPIGLTEEENVMVKQWGKIPTFSFPVKSHADIANTRGWLDKERAAKVTGARFAYLKGDLVKLHYAIIHYAMDIMTDEKILEQIAENAGLKNISTKIFTLVMPPLMIRTDMYDAMDRLEPREDRYKIEGEDLWLQGSAEHVLGSIHANEIIGESEFPVRYLGYATSFRQEAGTYGKDMEGFIRMHQFEKMEMESLCTQEQSMNEHLFHIAIQEYVMQQLELPYQKIQKCTFDIGKPNARGVDIEVWLPAQEKYRETHTADYMTDYQSRRLQTRVRRTSGEVELVHTNDATLFSQRPLIAIIENYQNEDCTVTVPRVLRNYIGGKERI